MSPEDQALIDAIYDEEPSPEEKLILEGIIAMGRLAASKVTNEGKFHIAPDWTVIH